MFEVVGKNDRTWRMPLCFCANLKKFFWSSCRDEDISDKIVEGLFRPDLCSRFDHNVSNSVADIEKFEHSSKVTLNILLL